MIDTNIHKENDQYQHEKNEKNKIHSIKSKN